MSLKYGLLGLLNYKDMTGYELSKTFKDSLSFFWQAQTTQIYRELNTMEKDKWLTSHIQIQTEKPNRRIYSITDTGRKAFHEWLQADMPHYFYPTRSEGLMRAFFFGQNNISVNIQKLKKMEEEYQSQLARIESSSNIIAQYSCNASSELDILSWNLTKKFGESFCKMCIEWIQNTINELETKL